MLVFASPDTNSDPKTNRKSNLEIDMKKSSFLVQKCPKSPQNGSPKSSKNRQNPSLGLAGSFLVPSNVPGSSQDRPSTAPGSPQDRPRVPQDAKVEAPSMPNGIRGYQNPAKINKNQTPGPQSVVLLFVMGHIWKHLAGIRSPLQRNQHPQRRERGRRQWA